MKYVQYFLVWKNEKQKQTNKNLELWEVKWLSQN